MSRLKHVSHRLSAPWQPGVCAAAPWYLEFSIKSEIPSEGPGKRFGLAGSSSVASLGGQGGQSVDS
eukprot:1377914-Amorphochlora_amoeboformis.AAC.1